MALLLRMVCVGQRYYSTPLHQVPQGKALCCLLDWISQLLLLMLSSVFKQSIHHLLQYSDGNCFGEFFSVGFVQRIGKLECELVCARFQFDLPFRLCFSVMFVGRIHRNDGALGRKSFAFVIVDDDVVMAGAFNEPIFRGRELEAGEVELVGKFARHGVAVFNVGKVHSTFRALGVRVRRGQCRGDECHRGGGASTEKMAAGVL